MQNINENWIFTWNLNCDISGLQGKSPYVLPVPPPLKKKKVYSRESVLGWSLFPILQTCPHTPLKMWRTMIVRCYPYNCPNLIACWIAIHNSEHNIYAIFYTVNTEQHFQCVKAKGKKKKFCNPYRELFSDVFQRCTDCLSAKLF